MIGRGLSALTLSALTLSAVAFDARATEPVEDPRYVRALSHLGDDTHVRFGRDLALADLDGDGCDEVAVGAPEEANTHPAQGVIRIMWGAGGLGCPASVEVTLLALEGADTRAGVALAGGGDVDGDGIGDLAVGSPTRSVGGLIEGARRGGSPAPGSWPNRARPSTGRRCPRPRPRRWCPTAATSCRRRSCLSPPGFATASPEISDAFQRSLRTPAPTGRLPLGASSLARYVAAPLLLERLHPRSAPIRRR